MDAAKIKDMSTEERLQTMELLWDALLEEEGTEVDSPQWHGDVIEKRKEKIKNGNAEFISLEELKAKRTS